MTKKKLFYEKGVVKMAIAMIKAAVDLEVCSSRLRNDGDGLMMIIIMIMIMTMGMVMSNMMIMLIKTVTAADLEVCSSRLKDGTGLIMIMIILTMGTTMINIMIMIKTATATAEPDLEVGPSAGWNEGWSDDEQLLSNKLPPPFMLVRW